MTRREFVKGVPAAGSGVVLSPRDAPASSGVRVQVDLSGPWRFQVDTGDEGVKVAWFSAGFDVQNWREVSLPRAFDDCAPGMDRYRGICWFQRNFEVPSSMSKRRIVLRFEGVNNNATVWVNGRQAGENADPFLPFEIPVHKFVRPGERNSVVVRVDNLRRPAQVPPTEGWLGQGGILREVTLIATDFLYIEHLRIVAEPSGAHGKFSLRASLNNDRGQASVATLAVEIADSKGRQMATLRSDQITLRAGESSEAAVEGSVGGIEPWSPDKPALYSARAVLLSNGQAIDDQDVRFGFRRIEWRGEKLVLNGTPIFLTGFNRHEDSPHTGMATDLDTVQNDLFEMKRAGANFVRLCHYPHHPGELGLCDELGLFAMDEIPLYGWGWRPHPYAGGGWNAADAPAILEAARRQLRKMILRDLNHPSVIFWSVSNETEESHPEVVEANNALIRLGRELDPSRPVTHVSHRWRSPDAVKYFTLDDVISINGYIALAARARKPDPTDRSWMEDATREWTAELAKLHAAYPGKLILVTEFGYTSIEGTNGPQGEDTQALAFEAAFRAMTAPYLCGATLWCFAKHPWPPGGFGRLAFDLSPYGYVSRDRRRKLKGFVVAAKMFKERQMTLEKG